MTETLTHTSAENIIERLSTDENDPRQMAEICDSLFQHLLDHATEAFRMPFNTVFSQLAFITSQFKVEHTRTRALHYYRLNHLHHPDKSDVENLKIRRGILSLLNDMVFGTKTERFADLQTYALRYARSPKNYSGVVREMRFSITEAHLEEGFFLGWNEDDPDAIRKVVIDEASREALLTELMEDLNYFSFPMTVTLINVNISGNEYHPECIILLPDFLIDVTAIAECYSYDGVNPKLHFIKKLMPSHPSDSLFLGLCANSFLDELVFRPNLDFKELIPRLFKISPLYLASLSDDKVIELVNQAKTHYHNILDFVRNYREGSREELQRALIEPSYCSPTYGLQGRLDLYIDSEDNRSIIELKSGKLFRENKYGINQSHYIQTLLYDLLVRKNEKSDKDLRAFILYSRLEGDRLRFAPPVRSLQLDALMTRNRILTMEYRFALIGANGNDPTDVFGLCLELMREGQQGYIAQNLKFLHDTLNALTSVELKYLKAFTGFVAREYFTSKSGLMRDRSTTGQAALWLNTAEEKAKDHLIMAGLLPESVEITHRDTLITFRKSPMTDLLADFRIGDIVVLYAPDKEGNLRWEGRQLFRGTLVENNSFDVTIRLRARQNRKDLIFADRHWNMEKDVIDSGITGQFRSLISWAASDVYNRKLLLGLIPPAKPERRIEIADNDISPYHRELLENALSAPDYFLLWGPPGTGKTRYMVKNLIQLVIANTEKPVLVLAYTNRAVDELCNAIESISPEYCEKYIRIGSRYGTDPSFVGNLLDEKLLEISNRKQLLELLHTRRIIIGTASALLGKTELFSLLSFEWALIDEASQILDPQIIELLSYVPKFIMIGDHKQLPAVVTQHRSRCLVTDREMNDCGIFDLSQSLFERLYLRAIQQGWDWAYGVLHRQGRMHSDIMTFPARHFYDNRLETLFEHQIAQDFLRPATEAGHSGRKAELSRRRMLFFDVRQENFGFQKMNNAEATLIRGLLLDLHDLYRECGRRLEDTTIGIITPFRAQIVNISTLIESLPFKLDIIVDTVERFQGGARDIIILSMVVSSPSHAASIISANIEGIDRKMNVALTRARERLIMIGNQEVLEQLDYYREFVQEYGVSAMN
ncbi:MAG TPA: AAA domain-containing protein [Saprospiraceae bacterium]|nr:AAA domain-containing protein [Saprospiraceae bacterium]